METTTLAYISQLTLAAATYELAVGAALCMPLSEGMNKRCAICREALQLLALLDHLALSLPLPLLVGKSARAADATTTSEYDG
eukprot:3838811-Pleurochrysis_carterae.AAC.3